MKNPNRFSAEKLYREHHEHIFRFVWSRVHDVQSAEDLTGEVFTRMVANLPTYQERALPFRAWLYRIARNLIIDQIRKESTAAALEDAAIHHPAPNSPEEKVETALTLARVHQALKQIDPAQREVVELRFLAQLSLKEVAAVIDKSVPAVKALQHRGLAALRVHLQD